MHRRADRRRRPRADSSSRAAAAARARRAAGRRRARHRPARCSRASPATRSAARTSSASSGRVDRRGARDRAVRRRAARSRRRGRGRPRRPPSPCTCWPSAAAACRATGSCSSASAWARCLSPSTTTCSTRAPLDEALAAQVWLVGSLNGRGWADVRPLAVGARRAAAGGRAARPRAADAGARRRRGARARRRRSSARGRADLRRRRRWPRWRPPRPARSRSSRWPRRRSRAGSRAPRARASRRAALMGAAAARRRLRGQRLPGDVQLPVGVRHRRARRRLPGLAAGPRVARRRMTPPAGRRTSRSRTTSGSSRALDVAIPDGSFTVIVGPNACGKSTLLRALARLLKPRAATVLLDGRRSVAGRPRRSRAGSGCCRRAGRAGRDHRRRPGGPRPLPAPAAAAPVDARGRARGAERDGRTGVDDLAEPRRSTSCPAASASASGSRWCSPSRRRSCCSTSRPRSSTSRTRSRCWTCAPSCTSGGRTLVAVLHDLNQACRYATHLVAMREGEIVAEGAPAEIVDAELVERVFGLRCQVIEDPETGTPLVVPPRR